MPTLRIARKYHFNAGKVENSISRKITNSYYRLKLAIKQKLKKSWFLHKLVNNHLIRKIGQNDYFKRGAGYRLKQKVKNLLSA